MRAYFGQFGFVEDFRLKEDKITSKILSNSDKFRGFAFLRYKDQKAVQAVLSVKQHQYRGVLIEVKKAATKEDNDKQVSDKILRNIFLA